MRIYIIKKSSVQWAWAAYSKTGKLRAVSGQYYTRKASAKNAAKTFQKDCPTAAIYILE